MHFQNTFLITIVVAKLTFEWLISFMKWSNMCIRITFLRISIVANITLHTAPKGGQKSKFENPFFVLKPSYLTLTIMFEPKNMDTSNFRLKNWTCLRGGWGVDLWNMANLLCKLMVLRNPKSAFSLIFHRCHPLWDGLLYYIFHPKSVIGTGKSRNPPIFGIL